MHAGLSGGAIDGAARAAIILGQAVDWTALYAYLLRTCRWSARRVNKAMPGEILMHLKPPAGEEQTWRRCGKPIS